MSIRKDWMVNLQTGNIFECEIGERGQFIGSVPGELMFTHPSYLAHGFESKEAAEEYLAENLGGKAPDTILNS